MGTKIRFYVNEIDNAHFSLAVMGSINMYANEIGNGGIGGIGGA